MVNRRQFLAMAAAAGASLAMGGSSLARTSINWRERRDLFAEGVASGDPQPDNVLLWTRYSGGTGKSARLYVEIADDAAFTHIVASARTTAKAANDWTCRVLVAALEPRKVYWYRFSDTSGAGSRIGRTMTAPANDERAADADRLGFVLHLGDFIYEIVWYPEDRPQGMYDRSLRDITRYPHGEKIRDFHVPVTLADYREVYRSYLRDPDLQDARARWPFVAIWDNHEFSWKGWQSMQKFDDKVQPAQTRRVAANQAWFEYQPARVRQPRGVVFDSFSAPKVVDAPVTRTDESGFGDEPNNRAAVRSLTVYRAFRYGRHVDLIITDQHSYRGEEPTEAPEAAALTSADFPNFVPQEAMEIIDAGRAYDGGKPPATIRFGDKEVPNFRRNEPPHSILGAEQKRWFLERLRTSRATWKIWGNSMGTLEFRADPENLPEGVGKKWPGAGYASFGGGDYSGAFIERAEIYDAIRQAGITGFATISGDRHSFWAVLAAKALPPLEFNPVGVAFITGSISAPGLVEAS